VCKGKDEVLADKEQEIAIKKRTLSDERQRVRSLTDECAILGSELEHLTVSHSNAAGHTGERVCKEGEGEREGRSKRM